eukprot:scaffold246_cov414-Prasinococcus_capsulatus_cf.AAC.16
MHARGEPQLPERVHRKEWLRFWALYEKKHTAEGRRSANSCAYVVRGVHVGAKLKEKLGNLDLSLVGRVVERGIASLFHDQWHSKDVPHATARLVLPASIALSVTKLRCGQRGHGLARHTDSTSFML